MPNIIKTKGFIIKTAPFRESSLFTTILTKDYGKIKVLAKGARRPRSKFCGSLELFNLDEVIYYKKETKEVYTLSDTAVVEDFKPVRKIPQKVSATMVLCEFFDKALPPEERAPVAFRLFYEFVRRLQKVKETLIKPFTYCYLIKTLPTIGIVPQIHNCIKCNEPIIYDNKEIDFSIAAGGVVCASDYDDTVIMLSTETVELMKKILQNKEFVLEPQSLLELEKLLPDYLFYHLNNIVLNSLRHL